MRFFYLVIIGMILVVTKFASAGGSSGVNPSNDHIGSAHYYKYKTGEIYDVWNDKHLMTAEGACRKGAKSLFKNIDRSHDLAGIQQETDICLMEVGYERVDIPGTNSNLTPPSNSSSAETFINELNNLRAKGLITEEEYNKNKAEISKDF